ncbi:MAG: ABC transporter ATP-binding protein [Pirellulales bacterium]|nr:ABC transporter ATP-binding protein [Pirellulales bacterium]
MIEVIGLNVQSGAFRLADVHLHVPAGRYAVLMGRTGSGKTTLLEAICGLKSTTAGCIRLCGHEVTHLKAAQRGIGFVPQDGALFQTMTVREHLEFALTVRRWSRDDRRARVAEMARLVGVEHLLDRRPQGLSGGEQQRVALGRALSFRPPILCLDEPLSALDDDSRLVMIDLLKRVQQETGVTALHVTHNRLEAERLADERIEIGDGRVRVLSTIGGLLT